MISNLHFETLHKIKGSDIKSFEIIKSYINTIHNIIDNSRNILVGSAVKPVGTHLVNLAKQQLESMLVVLKEYEAEDECAAQVPVCMFVCLVVYSCL